jgi:hypothetical protein
MWQLTDRVLSANACMMLVIIRVKIAGKIVHPSCDNGTFQGCPKQKDQISD